MNTKSERKMTNLLQENIEMKTQRTNSTFAISTSHNANQKLQKNYFFATLLIKRKIMILKKLILKNFRAYKNIEVEFDNKLNVIIGKNNIGKSTILEALEIFFNN